MRPTGIRAVATWLPRARDTGTAAVERGEVTAEDLRKVRTAAVRTADHVSAPELAVRAARRALREASVPADRVGLLLHAWTHHQGHDFWSPAHHVAARLGLRDALPVGIHQMCNGGSTAVELAAAWLAEHPGRLALVTTGDRFVAPGFDRWGGDYGVAYGDAGTALLLGAPAAGDVGTVVAAATAAAPDLETVHRGADPVSPAPRWHSSGVDVRRTKRRHLADHGTTHLADTTVEVVSGLVDRVVAAAGLGPDDRPDAVVLPRLGDAALASSYRPALARSRALAAVPVHDLGRDTGHLGAGDTAANLAALLGGHGADGHVVDGHGADGHGSAAALRPGRTGLAVSGGGGFTWSVFAVTRAGAGVPAGTSVERSAA